MLGMHWIKSRNGQAGRGPREVACGDGADVMALTADLVIVQ
jgi:hypothetical protein